MTISPIYFLIFSLAHAGVVNLGIYPDYDGDISVSGIVSVTNSEEGIQLVGSLSGLENKTTGGIHIHSGMSCDSSEDVGGHYFEGMDSDPWTTTYTSDEYGVSQVSFEMADFSLYGDYPVSGRAVVIHAEDGTRVACGLLSGGEAEIATLKIYPEYTGIISTVLAVGTVSVTDVEAGGILLEASLSGLEQGRVANLGLYPDYDGDISVSGTVTVTNVDGGIQLEGSLSGLEPGSTGGIHIHSGMSCDYNEGVGGHYFEGMDSDPWTTTYTSDEYGVSQVSFGMRDFSLNGDYPVSGRAVVIHAEDGTRVACGLLSDGLIGGIHIHSGMSCDTTEDVGGHYFEGMDSDPWTTTYTPDDYGVSQVSFEMEDFSLHGDCPVSGRAVVIHAVDGTRVACGQLEPAVCEVCSTRRHLLFGTLPADCC